MVERKVFLANLKLQYHVSQCREYGCSAQSQNEWRLLWESSLTHLNELWLWEKWWKKMLFWPNQSINIMYPNEANLIVVPIKERMEIIMHIQVCLISQINFNNRENGRNKSFSCQIKASISSILIRWTWL